MSFSQLYFSFNGRIRRKTYWLKGVLPIFVLSLIIGLIDYYADTNQILSTIWSVILIWPGLALSIKRWHDRDKSGWWVLITLIPIVGPIWALVELGFLAGTMGPNKFGAESY